MSVLGCVENSQDPTSVHWPLLRLALSVSLPCMLALSTYFFGSWGVIFST